MKETFADIADAVFWLPPGLSAACPRSWSDAGLCAYPRGCMAGRFLVLATVAVALSAMLGVISLTMSCTSGSLRSSICPPFQQSLPSRSRPQRFKRDPQLICRQHSWQRPLNFTPWSSVIVQADLNGAVPGAVSSQSASLFPQQKANEPLTKYTTAAASREQASQPQRSDAAPGRQGNGKCIATCLQQKQLLEHYHDGWDVAQEQEYPLRDEILPDSFIKGDVSRLQLVLDKLLRGERVVVVIIGGSYTMGVGCHDTLNRRERECSWSSRVRRWFGLAFPMAKLDWHDESQGATPTLQFLSGLGAMIGSYQKAPDLVLINTLINDAGWPRNMIQGGGISAITDDEAIGAGFEMLLMSLQEIAPAAQLLVVLDGCPRCVARMHFQKNVTMHHNIPIVDYAGLTVKYNYVTPGQYKNETRPPSRLAPTRLWPREEYKEWHKGVTWPKFLPLTEQFSKVAHRASFVEDTVVPPVQASAITYRMS
eukprot:TRINITY_DN20115_c0_g1_i1.p1 TRINITY_DN20115_c0_g1~~TRINITY_DN20115_c0_g1_i1.p1  ORF type:complete len:481 (+),score=36.81 TRINITY_DN20115_c0_g1_i1:58-1500(+)